MSSYTAADVLAEVGVLEQAEIVAGIVDLVGHQDRGAAAII